MKTTGDGVGGAFAEAFLAKGAFASHEADGLAKAFHVLGTSDLPYVQWFRKEVAEIHGLTPEILLGPPPAQLILDCRE